MTDNTIGREIGRKLSVAELGYDKEAIQKLVLANTGEKHFLARFVGTVTGLKPYKIKDGDRAGEIAFGLQGMFEGTGANGEIKDGSVCYLPGYVNDAIVAAFSASGDDDITVRLAIDVYAKYDKTSATSYTFTCNDLLNTGSESVDEVKAAIASLPMPSPVAALEDKSKK